MLAIILMSLSFHWFLPQQKHLVSFYKSFLATRGQIRIVPDRNKCQMPY